MGDGQSRSGRGSGGGGGGRARRGLRAPAALKYRAIDGTHRFCDDMAPRYTPALTSRRRALTRKPAGSRGLGPAVDRLDGM